MINNDELPIGFTMELAQHSDALLRFSNMPPTKQQAVINGAKEVTSRQEMKSYVANIMTPEATGYEKNKFF